MNTPNIPDDELDDFFRKSLEKPEIDFREEDWLRLEKRLNTVTAHQKSANRKFLYSLAALLLLSGGLITWLLVGTSPDKTAGTSTQLLTNKEVLNQESTSDKIFIQPLDSISNPATAQQGELFGEGKPPATALPEKTGTHLNKVKSLENTPIATGTEKELTTKIQSDEDKSTNESNETPALPSRPALKDRNNKVTKQTNNKSVNQNVISDKALQNTSKESGSPNLTKKPASGITETNHIAKQTSRVTKSRDGGITPADQANSPNSSDKRQTTGSIEVTESEKKTPVSESRNNLMEEETTGIDSNDIALSEKAMEDEAGNKKFAPVSPLSPLAIRTSGIESNLPEKYTDSLERKIIENSIALQKDSTQRKLAKERLISRFSLNLLLSPDLSSVGFSHRAAPGTNTGISLEYHFSNTWSISAGAIYSTKIYGADAKDYTPKPGFWTYYVWPVEVKGNCKVIDIPINVRYNFLRREKSNVFATTGLSSYLMLKEDYKYIYDVDDTHLRKYWHTSNENKHFFKVYNFSLGYERRLSPKFSLQAEPFIKLPLAGVGFGQIKLLTTGAFVSVKYRL